METTFNGLGMSLGNLSLLSAAQTRSISAENFDGHKGQAGMATEGTGAVPARELGRWRRTNPIPDYFCGAWNFEHPPGEYGVFCTPYSGLPQVIKPDGLYQSQQRFGMYRWHIMDPIRFREDLKVTIQALGWRATREGQRRYLPLQDDIASTAFWYQKEPHAKFPSLPEFELSGGDLVYLPRSCYGMPESVGEPSRLAWIRRGKAGTLRPGVN